MRPDVDAMWCAWRRMPSWHSGCAMTSASGCRAISSSSRRSENVSCTMQVPCHSTRSSRLACFFTNAPRCLSGANTIGTSPSAFTIFTAFDDVQITSDSAFTSAEQLM